MSKIILKPLPKENPEKEKDRRPLKEMPAFVASEESAGLTVAEYLIEKAEKDNCQLFGIVDSARNDEVFRYLVTGDVKYKSLFDGTMDVQSYGVSGFLVECKKESPLFQWMTTEAWGDNCCIFFTSKASFEDLFKHFQQFNRVYLEGDDVVLFRFYDPRVLRDYLPTCTGKELEIFFGEILGLFAENKDPGMINVFKINKTADSDQFSITTVKIQKT